MGRLDWRHSTSLSKLMDFRGEVSAASIECEESCERECAERLYRYKLILNDYLNHLK